MRKLEQADEILLSIILGCDSNTNNVFKYLELGVKPVRFEVMKRKLLFLQYILQQDEKSMVYQVLDATIKNPIKNDFVSTCKKYLEFLEINLTFEAIKSLSKWKFKRLMKEKIEKAAFTYLIGLKNKIGRDGRVSKIAKIKYDRLEIQQYMSENKTTTISKFIVKARSCTLDIKTQKSWKYEDKACVGCGLKEENGNEILNCEKLGTYEENQEIPAYEWFYSENCSKMVMAAKEFMKRLKVRQRILENY